MTTKQFEEAKKTNPAIKSSSRVLLQYRESHDGYFTSEKFLIQVESAIQIAEYKYLRSQGCRLYFIFDQSSCHTAYGEDALHVDSMNVKPGGVAPKMHDTVCNGKGQSMDFPDSTPKRMARVLQDCGINISGMKGDNMRHTLASHSDFKNEKNRVEWLLHCHGHACIFLPKLHGELNPIERVWALAKRYMRAHCNYTLQGRRRTVPQGLDRVTVENIRKFFRKTRDYMFGYLKGLEAGNTLETQVKLYKSRRRVGVDNRFCFLVYSVLMHRCRNLLFYYNFVCTGVTCPTCEISIKWSIIPHFSSV